MRDRACAASYLWTCLLRTLLLLTACSAVEGACPKSCSCQLPNEVHCTFRYLTMVPQQIQPAVEKINLGYNSISVLKENDLAGLKNLELLMLHSNAIHNIEDKAFKDLKSLQVLKMSYNKVKKINKDTFTGLKSLLKLHLDHNYIEFINPDAFYGLTHLQSVNLEGNYLQQIHPDTFITMRYNQLFEVSSVKSIHLSDNLLSSLPVDLFPSSLQLENLFLHGNPWSCDCRMAWFPKWMDMNVGVLKCKRDRRYPRGFCPICLNPGVHHNRPMSLLSSDAFTCTRPWIQPHLKHKNITLDEGEYSHLSPKDFIAPLGSIQMNLTDHFHNEGSLSCTVQQPSASENVSVVSGEDGAHSITAAVTTYLVCNVDHEHMQQLWQILAIYSDSPLQLRRGPMLAQSPEMVYRYSQVKPIDEEDDYHTNIEAVLKASPAFLMQQEINLQLDRTATTFSTLHVKYQSVVSLRMDNAQTNKDGYSWTMIKRDNQTKTEHAAIKGSVAQFSCLVVGKPKPIIEWIFPDGNKVRSPYSSEDKRILVTADGKLTIRALVDSDTGLYHCIATNYLDADILTFRLAVLSPDVEEAEINGVQLSKSQGERLLLECGTSGSPKPSVRWILPDHTVMESTQDHKKLNENGSLQIESLTHRDRGYYRCLVANKLGLDLLVSHVGVIEREPSTVTVLDQLEMEIKEKTDSNKANIENSSSFNTSSQESRTITSDRPYPKFRSRGRENIDSNLGLRRRGYFSNRNRVLDRSYKKVDPERFAEILKNIKNRGKTQSSSKPEDTKLAESHLFSGDDEVSSGENPDDFDLPHIVKLVTTTPKNTIQWTKRATTKGISTLINDDEHFSGTTESYFLHKPTQMNNPVAQTQTYHPDSQSEAIAPYVTVLQNKHFSTFNEPTDVYTWARTSNLASNKHQVREQSELHQPSSNQDLEDSQTSTEAAVSFAADPHVTPMSDGTGPLVYTSTDPESQTTFTAVTTAERQKDEITFHTTQTIKSPSLHSGSTIISQQQIHVIPHKNGRGGGRRRAFQGRRRIIKPNRITDIQSFISKVKQTTAKKDGNTTVPLTIHVTTECECDNNGPQTAVRDVQVFTPTASPAQRSTTVRYTSLNSDSPLKEPTHAGPRELVSTSDYITSADAPEHDHTIAPVLTTKQESSATAITGRIQWTGPFGREYISNRPRKPSITPSISTTAETTTVTATTTPATVPSVETNAIAVPNTMSPIQSHVKESSGDDDYEDFSANFGFPTQKPKVNYQTFTTPSYYAHSSTATQALAESQTLPSPPTVRPPTAINLDVMSGSGSLPDNWLAGKRPSRTKNRHGGRGKPFRGRRPTQTTVGTTKVMTTASPASIYMDHEKMFTSGSTSRFTTTKAPRITSTRTFPATTTIPTTSKLFYTAGWNRAPNKITPTQKLTTTRTQLTKPTAKSTLKAEQGRTNTPASYQSSAVSRASPSVTTGYGAGNTAHSESTVSVIVTSKPKIVGGNAASFTVLSDSDAFLPCEAIGTPQPRISWRRFSTNTGNTITITGKVGKFEVLRNGTLLIQNANIKDRGQYLCLAENDQGSDKLLVTLSVVAYPSRILEPKMRELKSHAGNRVEINCKAEGRPAPMISWILANQTQVRGQNSQGRVSVTEQGTLVIEQVSIYDRGHYKCIASNPAGADTATVRLQVVAAPPGILEEKRQVVKMSASQNIWLPCTGHGSPQPSIHWVLFDGTVVPANKGARGSRISVHHNGTLHIKDALLSDSGKYECIATSSTGSDRRVVTLMIERYESMPQIMEISQRLTELYFGDQLTLNCTAKGEPTPTIIWRLPSKAVVDHWHRMGSRIQVLENGTLIINTVSDKDAGEYLCVARNTIGDDLQLLRVRVSMKPAKIETKLHDKKQVPFGKDLKVDCKASGAPKPEISWGLPDGTVVNSVYQSDSSSRGGGGRARRYTLFDNGTLFLNQVGMSEEGDYTCYAENQMGKDEMHVHITVLTAAPRIQTPTQTYARVKPGGNMRLDCQAIGEPKPKILWMLPSKDVIAASNERYLMHVNGSLDIRDVKLSDVGEYICMARNPAGESRKIYKIEIDGNPPVINGYNQNRTVIKDVAAKYSRKLIDCQAEGDPTPRVTWIMPDNIFLSAPYFGSRINVHLNGTLEIKNVRPTDTAEFICMARNDGGEAVMVVQLQVTGMLQRPIFKNPFNERIVSRIGKTVVLNCSANGHPVPEILWTLPNGTRFNKMQGHMSRHHLNNDGSLVIYSPQKEDAGKYRCGAKNYMGYIEKLVLLEVGQKPYILTRPRGIIRSVSGEPLFLHCLADGNPRPTIYWTIPGGHTLARPQVLGRYHLLENGTLIIQDTTVHDKGSYVCRARNDAGEAVLTVPVVIVAYPPRITTGSPPSVRAISGTPVQLSCVAVGIPKPEITWELPDHSLLSAEERGRPGGSELLHPQGSLIIQRPTVSDSGTYKCLAKNYLGTDSKATYVRVL